MSEAGSSGQPLLASISLLVDLPGPPTLLAATTELYTSTLPLLTILLALIMVSQLVDCLMKGANVAIGKRKLAAQVPLLLVDLAKLPLKVLLLLVRGLIPELCPGIEQLKK